MFSVGDKVVYPMHGAGIVQAIEQHELAGEAVDYLVMVMLLTDMRVMVPLKRNVSVCAILSPKMKFRALKKCSAHRLSLTPKALLGTGALICILTK